MKILLISNYLPDRQQSMLRYPQMLQAALSRRGHEVTVVHPPTVVGGLPLPPGPAKWLGYIDKFLIAPVYLRRKAGQHDVAHICDHSNAMYGRWMGSTPCVITCHDMIAVLSAQGYYAGVHTGRTGRVLQGWILSSLKQATDLICVSSQTETDFRSLAPDCRAQMRVILHALNRRCEPARQEEMERHMGQLGMAPNAQYLLHVGGNFWYKNRLGAMRIFAELRKVAGFGDMRLVMVGQPWSREEREFAASTGLGSWIVEATGLGDAALNALYSGAAALLFPSLMEGFGWPLLEAQACGCVVITSNRAPMTEVAGEAAIYVDPLDPAAAAKTIAEQWHSRAALREAGLRNAAKFTEKRMIEGYLQVYEEIAARARTGRDAAETVQAGGD